jgi:CBS domain-containing protein
MLVRNWMKHPVHWIKPGENALHARALLEEFRINQLPVLRDGELVGIVTDRDLRDAFPSVFEAAAARGSKAKLQASVDPERVTVEEIMSRRIESLTPNDPIVEAARLMRKHRIGAAPVVENGKLVGILTRSDLLDALVTMASDVEPVR